LLTSHQGRTDIHTSVETCPPSSSIISQSRESSACGPTKKGPKQPPQDWRLSRFTCIDQKLKGGFIKGQPKPLRERDLHVRRAKPDVP
jgi:hypothetical protein